MYNDNGSNHDYHFIIKKLVGEFKNQFTCLRENSEKYITFTAPIEKEVTRIDKNGEEILKYVSYILQFINSSKIYGKILWNLADNLSEGIHRIKYKFGHKDKKFRIKHVELKSDSHLPKKIVLFVLFVIWVGESSLKIMKNAFYFMLKALFVLKIFKLLSWLFGHVGNKAWLER